MRAMIPVIFRASLCRGFTLIELLAVIAIISLLLGLSIPVVKGTAESRKLQTSADLISGMAIQARQNSLGQNVLTAIVVLGKDAPQNRGLRSLALFELRSDTMGAVLSSSDWKQITPWRTIPEGIVIDDQASTFFQAPSAPPSPALPTSISVLSSTTADYHYRVFLHNGRMMGHETATLKLSPGILEQGNVLGNSDSASTNFLVISLVGTTGQVKFSRPQPKP